MAKPHLSMQVQVIVIMIHNEKSINESHQFVQKMAFLNLKRINKDMTSDCLRALYLNFNERHVSNIFFCYLILVDSWLKRRIYRHCCFAFKYTREFLSCFLIKIRLKLAFVKKLNIRNYCLVNCTHTHTRTRRVKI